MDRQQRFDELVVHFQGNGAVSAPNPGSTFGSAALRVNGHIFAMISHDRLVVKLPAARVDELVARWAGLRFDAGKGTPMKEWFALDPASRYPWIPLAEEALRFVEPHPSARESHDDSHKADIS